MKKAITTILCVVLFLIIGIFLYLYYNSDITIGSGKLPAFSKSISVSTELTPSEMKSDLDYLTKTLKDAHFKSANGFSDEQQALIKSSYEKIKHQMKVEDFYFIANEICCSFKDAHTSIYITETKKDKSINLPLIWLNDGLYINGDEGNLKRGDRIISIGNKNTDVLLEEFKKITPAENDQWVKFIASKNIKGETYLKYLEVVKNDFVEVKVNRAGKALSFNIPLVEVKEDSTSMKKSKKPYYTILKDSSLGIFTLNTCEADSNYTNKLEEFFKDVKENNIKNIAVDLRDNTGGNSKVIEEFMSYLNIDEYKAFRSSIRFSKEAHEQRGYLRQSGYINYKGAIEKNSKVKDNNLIFKGNTYILTSPITFSSANMFAVMFKDNSLGKIIGEPTGNAPSAYGDILEFQMPNSKFCFTVSHKQFLRPDTNAKDIDSLSPDILVYTKMDDIINEKDTQVEKLKEVISK